MQDSTNISDANKDLKRRSFSIYQIVSLSTLVCLTIPTSTVMSWSAVLPKIEEDTTHFITTKEDVSWLVSIITVIGMVTSLFAGSVIEAVGPKRLLLIISFPLVGSWLLMAFAPYISLLYIGRAIQAVLTCLYITAHHPLMAELSPPEKRGFLAATTEIIAAAGLLFGYILAHFLPWKMATLAMIIPSIPLLALLFIVPESPYWLIRHDKEEDAKQSLTKMLGKGDHMDEKINWMDSQSTEKSSIKNQIKLLRKRENAFPIALLWIIFIARELGGKTVLFSYSVYIFQQAGVVLDPFICTILLGFIRLIGHVIAACTTEHFGRKPCLILSSLLCGSSLGITGIFIMLDLPGKSWVCIMLLLLYVISFGVGLGPIPWTYMGELVPTPVRSFGAAFLVMTYNTAAFIGAITYFRITEAIGLGTTLAIFSLPCFLVSVLSIFWLPETKGRTLEDLKSTFNKEDEQR